MRKERKKYCFPSVLEFLSSVLLFSCIVGLVVVVLLFLFVSNGSLNLSNVMELLPAIIGMVLLVGILFAGSDFYRRYQTVERPVREIKIALDQLIGGDFATRIIISKEMTNEYHFDEIATSINALAQELSGVETLRTDFIANVSHELKTPLQGIIGSAELLESGLAKPEDAPRFVGHIRKEAARLVNLIEDIIRLSQLDEGVELPTEQVDMLQLSEDVKAILESSAAEKQITITVSGEGFAVEGVRRMLHEMVYNLCDNAIKYNIPGGSICIHVEQKKLTVSDTGIGIPAEHQSRVFERFYRVDKSHSKASGGTGLGLSIVKHAAAYHKAAVNLESTPGEGTTITVAF